MIEDERHAEKHAQQGRAPRDGQSALTPAPIAGTGAGRRAGSSHALACPGRRPHIRASEKASESRRGAGLRVAPYESPGWPRGRSRGGQHRVIPGTEELQSKRSAIALVHRPREMPAFLHLGEFLEWTASSSHLLCQLTRGEGPSDSTWAATRGSTPFPR